MLLFEKVKKNIFKTLKDFNLAKSRSMCILTLATLYVFITSSENLPL